MYLEAVFCISTLVTVVQNWPDGAPCKHTTMETMNPLEAAEHAGGLQLSEPPYVIDVKEQCYTKNRPIQLILRGNTTNDLFKGFAIQPLIYKGAKQDKRSGRFVRLDNNGSWRQQCFRFQDSVTNAHDEQKNEVLLWWKNDSNNTFVVQFVATVVQSQKVFWVKSVLSRPIPSCDQQKKFTDYVSRVITAPPRINIFSYGGF